MRFQATWYLVPSKLWVNWMQLVQPHLAPGMKDATSMSCKASSTFAVVTSVVVYWLPRSRGWLTTCHFIAFNLRLS
jgi:hypothetical protein